MPTGEAKITKGYRLLAHYVIHTPGPIWHGGNQNEADLLKNSYYSSLQLAEQYQCKTVAFPSISTGVYRYPLGLAAPIAVNTISRVFKNFPLCTRCYYGMFYLLYKNTHMRMR